MKGSQLREEYLPFEKHLQGFNTEGECLFSAQMGSRRIVYNAHSEGWGSLANKKRNVDLAERKGAFTKSSRRKTILGKG